MPTTPPMTPLPGTRLSRADLTARIGQLSDENGALRLENAVLRLRLARDRVRADVLAGLVDQLQAAPIAYVWTDPVNGPTAFHPDDIEIVRKAAQS